MTPAEFIAVLRPLPDHTPRSDAMQASAPSTSINPKGVWYSSQKEHVMGFLSEYSGPGAYGRKTVDGDARAWYQRFQCAAALVWLAEALGEDDVVVARGVAAVEAAGPHTASECGAFRKVVPWGRIEQLIAAQPRRSWLSRTPLGPAS